MAKPSPVNREGQDYHLQVPLERHYRFCPVAGWVVAACLKTLLLGSKPRSTPWCCWQQTGQLPGVRVGFECPQTPRESVYLCSLQHVTIPHLLSHESPLPLSLLILFSPGTSRSATQRDKLAWLSFWCIPSLTLSEYSRFNLLSTVMVISPARYQAMCFTQWLRNFSLPYPLA